VGEELLDVLPENVRFDIHPIAHALEPERRLPGGVGNDINIKPVL
jgi:hypothetical protein